jgi:hypothetical protein
LPGGLVDSEMRFDLPGANADSHWANPDTDSRTTVIAVASVGAVASIVAVRAMATMAIPVAVVAGAVGVVTTAKTVTHDADVLNDAFFSRRRICKRHRGGASDRNNADRRRRKQSERENSHLESPGVMPLGTI